MPRRHRHTDRMAITQRRRRVHALLPPPWQQPKPALWIASSWMNFDSLDFCVADGEETLWGPWLSGPGLARYVPLRDTYGHIFDHHDRLSFACHLTAAKRPAPQRPVTVAARDDLKYLWWHHPDYCRVRLPRV